MSKLNELKKQNKELDISFIDALSLVYKTKYVEMFLNLHKHMFSKEDLRIKNLFKEEMASIGFNREHMDEISNSIDSISQRMIMQYVVDLGYSNIRIFNKFIDLNERGLIENKDVTSYKSIDDMVTQISIAELKLVDKELEKLVIKIHDDEEWLIVKPLTYESSKKYGAGTKWCTAAESESYQFHNYTRRGNIIYIINKLTGYKVAAYKNLNKDYIHELSFWNSADDRIDSTEMEIPDNIRHIVIDDLRNCKKSNYDLAPDELKEKYEEPLKKVSIPIRDGERGFVEEEMHEMPLTEIHERVPDGELFHGEELPVRYIEPPLYIDPNTYYSNNTLSYDTDTTN